MKNRMIFLRSRKLPEMVRYPLKKGYLFYLGIKHLIQYQRTDIFERINIETSSICNRKCPYCPNLKYKRPTGRLRTKYIKKIILELKNLKFKGDIIFTGFNEPLMDTRIQMVIKYIRKHLPDNKVVIYTNGDFLSLGLFERLERLNVIFNVTLHQIKTPISPKNIFDIIKSKRNVNIKKNIENDILSSRGGLVKVSNPEKKSFCIFPYTEMTINYKGDFLLCCDDYFGSIKFGNIKKDKLIDTWNKERYKKIRENLINGKVELSICKKCMNLS